MSDPVDKAVEVSLENFKRLGVTEADGALYLPVELRRRNKDGGVDVVESAYLIMPTTRQRYLARVQSRAQGDSMKLDRELDKDLFDELENYALLTYALRDRKQRAQLCPTIEDLIDSYDNRSLAECLTRLDVWSDVLDPRYGTLSGEQLWQVIVAVAVGGDPLPLSGMRGFEQRTCIVLMAQEALRSPRAPSWARSPSTSASASSSATPSSSSSEKASTASDDVRGSDERAEAD
jgi:hypothetical protein